MLGFNATGSLALGQPDVRVTITQSVSAGAASAVVIAAGLQFMKAVNAAITSTVSSLRDAGKVVTVSAAGSVSFVRSVAKIVSAASFTAAVIATAYAVGKTISVTCSTSINLMRSAAQVIDVSCAIAASFLRRAWIEKTKEIETWVKRPRY